MQNKEIYKRMIDIKDFNNINVNPKFEEIQNDILDNNEGVVGLNGALMVDTGIFTGRSPKDKYFVEEDYSKNLLWWGPVNKKIDKNVFDRLFSKIIDFYKSNNNKTYVFEGFAGADSNNQIKVRVVAKKAWQYLFCRNMFIEMDEKDENFKPDFTIINASDIINEDYLNDNMNSEVFVIFNLEEKVAIIGGTEYGGEMKKGIFSLLHFLLPQKGVLSMHCSANVDNELKNPALFFGLSGTGKTTLSTDPNRPLIGDDEHGWSEDGIFNFEGGCYAKTINLDKEAEPDIYNAIKTGALLENVVYDEKTKIIDFSDNSKTENTRVSYPMNHIDNSLVSMGMKSTCGHPENIIFLTCDAYGVLPPISLLSDKQAMYHFISGYTAKVAGTERGVTEPTATFSPCFGGPFLTLHPIEYAKLLSQKIKKHNSKVFLVNTGWIGGSPSLGNKRISIQNTRAMITAILDGSVNYAEFVKENYFGLSIPLSLNNVDDNVLNPINAWSDKEMYDLEAKKLAKLFKDNFSIYGSEVEGLAKYGPTV